MRRGRREGSLLNVEEGTELLREEFEESKGFCLSCSSFAQVSEDEEGIGSVGASFDDDFEGFVFGEELKGQRLCTEPDTLEVRVL